MARLKRVPPECVGVSIIKGIVQAMVITKCVEGETSVFLNEGNVEVNHHRFFCCKLFELHLVEQTWFENNPRILEALLVLVLLGSSCRSSRRGSPHGMRTTRQYS